jgi:hypothetical protein
MIGVCRHAYGVRGPLFPMAAAGSACAWAHLALAALVTALVRAALLARGDDCDARSKPPRRHSAVEASAGFHPRFHRASWLDTYLKILEEPLASVGFFGLSRDGGTAKLQHSLEPAAGEAKAQQRGCSVPRGPIGSGQSENSALAFFCRRADTRPITAPSRGSYR